MRSRWLRAPALHFTAAGLALFALHALVARPVIDDRADDRVVVTAAFAEELREDHARRTGRLPTAEEERGLVERYVDDEVLYRRALALGLDRGDPIVRRRLVQKMEFLTRGATPPKEPSAAELAAWLAAHPERYRRPASVSFRHVFLSRDHRGDDVDARARAALAAVRAGADPGALGDPFLQGAAWSQRTAAELAPIFGDAFAEAVLALPAGAWSEPIRSSYGEHLVLVSAREDAGAPELARAREDWLAARREEDDRVALLRLRERYRVEIAIPR